MLKTTKQNKDILNRLFDWHLDRIVASVDWNISTLQHIMACNCIAANYYSDPNLQFDRVDKEVEKMTDRMISL